MKLSRFTWHLLLAVGFSATSWSTAADPGSCPYAAEQYQHCPLAEDYCDEYLYDYEIADLPGASAAQVNEADLTDDCPFRSIHDAIYDAEVYGFRIHEERAIDQPTATITVVHTLGRHSVEVVADEADSPTADAASVIESNDYYDGEADLYDHETYGYESYSYDYGNDLAQEPAEDDGVMGEVASDQDEWDEYDAYDEYDYDQYYDENHERELVGSESSELANEDAPMPYDPYGYDEFSVDESHAADTTSETSEPDYWGEAVEAQTAAAPATEHSVEERADLEPVTQALTAIGVLPLAEIVFGEISLDELAARLPQPKTVAASPADSSNQCDWDDWDCFYEFERNEATGLDAAETVESQPAVDFSSLERKTLKMLARTMGRTGRVLQAVSDDLMRISDSRVAEKESSQRPR